MTYLLTLWNSVIFYSFFQISMNTDNPELMVVCYIGPFNRLEMLVMSECAILHVIYMLFFFYLSVNDHLIMFSLFV